MPHNLLYWIVAIILIIVLIWVVLTLFGSADASTAVEYARHKAH